MRVLFLFLAVVLTSQAALDNAVRFAPPLDWVERREEPTLVPTPAGDVTYGYDYLMLDRQVNVREQSVYWRSVYRITSEGALQSGARFTWNFDPAYEQLVLHHLRVIRDGVSQERLSEALIKIIQRENDLERHLLNGESTAFALLDDIRVGDVIDSAYTRKGWNPTFGGHYFGNLATGWSVPVRKQYFRLTAPANHAVLHRAQGETPVALTAGQQGEDRVLTWMSHASHPIEVESELPSWFSAYPYIQFSEFESWAQVVAWAEPLYAVPEPLPDAIREKAAALTQGLSLDSDKAVAILQFVQQEIRYLGMELGAGSHRPSQPGVVLARRFGDCKDKTLLFCTLMRAAGLTAYPALLNTEYRDKIEDWLPSPQDFDHVIACLPQEGGYAWVDPTLSYQKGKIGMRGFPDYRRALVVRPGVDKLTTVTIPEAARSSAKIAERFDITAFDQPANFHVTTVYSGRSADSIRRYFAQTTPEQIAKYYVNYYASTYPGLSVVAAPTLVEDSLRNLVTIDESYTVPGLWKEEGRTQKLKAEFYPKTISDYAVRPKTTVRSMPLAVEHPAHASLTTVVNLPENWNVTPYDSITEDHAFRAKDSISVRGKVVTMNYSWESLSDHVPVELVPKHVETLNRYRDTLGYNLTYTKPAPAADPSPKPPAREPRVNWLLVLVTLVTVTVAGYAAIKVGRKRSEVPPLLVEINPELTGIGGWLILVAIGVTLRPLVLLGQLALGSHDSFNQDVWEAMTIPGRDSYQAALAPLIITETAGNLLLLIGSVLVLVLFYRRQRSFPVTFIVLLAFSAVFLVFDVWAGSHLLKHETTTKPGLMGQEVRNAIQSVAQALIWIPYLLVSRRVKATFTR